MIQKTNPRLCPICAETRASYLRTFDGGMLRQCPACGLIWLEGDMSPVGSGDLDERPRTSRNVPENSPGPSSTETEASKHYLDVLLRLTGQDAAILLIARPNHGFRPLAERRGVQVVEQMTVGEFEHPLQRGHASPVDAVVLLFEFEKCNSPGQVLDLAYSRLKPGGLLFVLTPSLDSRSARFFGNSWTEWRPENHYYFSNNTIQSMLLRCGFNHIELRPDVRSYTLKHIYERAGGFPHTWVTRAVRLFYHLAPTFFHHVSFRLPSSGIVVTARKAPRRKRPLLSIVLPVYNEAATFPTVMDQLAAKRIHGVDKEIIIVESNSTDGSRALVKEHEAEEGVRLIFQDRPRGKGNAVRAGLREASGDVILIQDADLEYDLNDYESLLEPVFSFKRAFVLGSRHSGSWKMRHFNDQQSLAAYFNLGHVVFTALLNLLYGQSMQDPFTMFKVFRRDCLHNLKFECDRFDFDFELVIKLIRKGYTPLEIPVNYYSRSFREGKKVQPFRDPLTWLKALVKFRFASIYSNPID